MATSPSSESRNETRYRSPTRAKVALEIAEDIGLSRYETNDLIAVVLQKLVDILIRDRELEIEGFGIWKLRLNRIPRPCKNFHTGEIVMGPSGRCVSFKAIGDFAERLDALHKAQKRLETRYPEDG